MTPVLHARNVGSGNTTVDKAQARKELPLESKWGVPWGEVTMTSTMTTEKQNVPEAGKHVASLRDWEEVPMWLERRARGSSAEPEVAQDGL